MEEAKPRRRASSRCRDERIDRRVVFNDLPPITIDLDAELTTETRRQADMLFRRLDLKGYKTHEKQSLWRCLFHAAKRAHHCGGCIMYPRNRSHTDWSSIGEQVIDAAVAAGLFQSFRSLPGRSPHMSRLIATPELAQYVKPDPWAFDQSTTPLVFLRERETEKDIPFDAGHATPKRFQERLEQVNLVNGQYRITCRVQDPWGKVAPRQLRPVHYAIFTNDWEHHGRLYTGQYGHQSLKGIERSTIEFDGEPSVELDYSGFHCRMLYHQEGIDFQHDPYRLWGPATTPDLRRMAKQVVNSAINAKDRRAAISACNLATCTKTKGGDRKRGKAMEDAIQLHDALRNTGISFAEVYDKALERHHRIAHRFGQDAGMTLMNLDGKIALSVLHHFASRSIPCLGVHDSFIVPRHAEAELRQIMLSTYEKRLGYLPVIKGQKSQPYAL
jgi:hypothetical protein